MKQPPIISTLITPGITNIRRDGNTTRQVDFAIQMAMRGYPIKILDHHNNGESAYHNKILHKLIFKRIKEEHPNAFTKFDIDGNFIVEL